jgi:DNA polymerase III psi subunit
MPSELRGVLNDKQLVRHDVRDVVHALQLTQVVALCGATDQVAHLQSAKQAAISRQMGCHKSFQTKIVEVEGASTFRHSAHANP